MPLTWCLMPFMLTVNLCYCYSNTIDKAENYFGQCVCLCEMTHRTSGVNSNSQSLVWENDAWFCLGVTKLWLWADTGSDVRPVCCLLPWDTTAQSLSCGDGVVLHPDQASVFIGSSVTSLCSTLAAATFTSSNDCDRRARPWRHRCGPEGLTVAPKDSPWPQRPQRGPKGLAMGPEASPWPQRPHCGPEGLTMALKASMWLFRSTWSRSKAEDYRQGGRSHTTMVSPVQRAGTGRSMCLLTPQYSNVSTDGFCHPLKHL